jgi:eukaryotic-like serine/threonine-protein kinase
MAFGGDDESDWTALLPRYRVVGELGVGRSSRVWLAADTGRRSPVQWCALKRLAVTSGSLALIQMLIDDVRAASRIGHPSVANVVGLGVVPSVWWIARAYIHGEPLREVMRRLAARGATLPPALACRLVAAAADGLHAGHELVGRAGQRLDLVHRSVNPDELYATFDGRATVTGFGVARADALDVRVGGALGGKLAYMSPEQVQGEAVDRRTDVFALGVVLWELVTGKPLFRAETDLDTLTNVQRCEVPAPSRVAPGCPPALDDVVRVALAKSPTARFETALAFGDAVRAVGDALPAIDAPRYVSTLLGDCLRLRDGQLHRGAATLRK